MRVVYWNFGQFSRRYARSLGCIDGIY